VSVQQIQQSFDLTPWLRDPELAPEESGELAGWVGENGGRFESDICRILSGRCRPVLLAMLT